MSARSARSSPDFSKCDCGAGPRGIHSHRCALIKSVLDKPRSATPSEAVTWKRIGAPRSCTKCGRKLKLDEVREFGTVYVDEKPVRFVHCGCPSA